MRIITQPLTVAFTNSEKPYSNSTYPKITSERAGVLCLVGSDQLSKI